jgi:hypothetical protein
MMWFAAGAILLAAFSLTCALLLKERCADAISRIAEDVFEMAKRVEALEEQRTDDEKADEEMRKRAVEEEKAFNEGVASILGYSLNVARKAVGGNGDRIE